MSPANDMSAGVPADAGPYTQALAEILNRIPPRWGRHIDVESGWYPLVADVDRQLRNLDPDYIVHQVKQKYGTLRYYCWPSGDEPSRSTLDAFESITEEAEGVSAVTCERCGGAESSLCHQANGLHVRTLCSSCAEALNYESSN
jgi:hypothetical protein